MTIVHSEAPWGQPEEERLAPKERTHPMRPLSRNNNTTTRLKRGPNPLSGVLVLVLNFFVVVVYFLFLYFLIFFLYLFVCLFFYYYYFFVFIFIFFFFYMLYPWGQPQQTIKSPGYREVLNNPLSGILIPRPPGDNHNKPSSPQATERS